MRCSTARLPFGVLSFLLGRVFAIASEVTSKFLDQSWH